jgi:hypothetical protein
MPAEAFVDIFHCSFEITIHKELHKLEQISGFAATKAFEEDIIIGAMQMHRCCAFIVKATWKHFLHAQ